MVKHSNDSSATTEKTTGKSHGKYSKHQYKMLVRVFSFLTFNDFILKLYVKEGNE